MVATLKRHQEPLLEKRRTTFLCTAQITLELHALNTSLILLKKNVIVDSVKSLDPVLMLR